MQTDDGTPAAATGSTSPPPTATQAGPVRLTADQIAAKKKKWLASQTKRWSTRRTQGGGGVDMGKVVRPSLSPPSATPSFVSLDGGPLATIASRQLSRAGFFPRGCRSACASPGLRDHLRGATLAFARPIGPFCVGRVQAYRGQRQDWRRGSARDRGRRASKGVPLVEHCQAGRPGRQSIERDASASLHSHDPSRFTLPI